jgi:hypothetical protein
VVVVVVVVLLLLKEEYIYLAEVTAANRPCHS